MTLADRLYWLFMLSMSLALGVVTAFTDDPGYAAVGCLSSGLLIADLHWAGSRLWTRGAA